MGGPDMQGTSRDRRARKPAGLVYHVIIAMAILQPSCFVFIGEPPPRYSPMGFAMSADGATVASALARRWGRDFTAVWRVSDPMHAVRFPYSSRVALSPDGSTIAMALGGDVILMSTRSRKRTMHLQAPGESVGHIAFSPSARTLAVYGGGRVCMVSLESGQVRHSFEVDTERVPRLAFSDDSQQLAVAGSTKLLLWDAASSRIVWSVPQRVPWADWMVFSGDGQLLAAVDDDAVAVWETRSGNLRWTRSLDSYSVNVPLRTVAVAFSIDGHRLVVVGDRGNTLTCDALTGNPLGTTDGDCSIVVLGGITPSRELLIGVGYGTYLLAKEIAAEAWQ